MRTIIVKGKVHFVPQSEVEAAIEMVEQYKTAMEIATALRRTRQYAHALKMSILDDMQMEGVV